MKVNAIFSLGVILASLVSVSWAGKCPTDDEVTAIDLSQFSGEWYVVSTTGINGQVGKCLHFQVDQVSSTEFYMNFTTTSYRNNQRISWNIVGQQDEKKLSATWQLSFSPRTIGPFDHQILTIDYKSYCAMIVCAPDTQYIPKQYFAMILSRERTLPEDTLTDLNTKISEYIAKEDIVDVDNTCSELDSQ